MNYSAAMNEALLAGIRRTNPILAFGQNIGAGSHLSGLTRGINEVVGCEVLNTPNCENAQVGFGFGMMLEGANSIFIVKQQDFMLLTLDQLVNTANLATQSGGIGAFTVAFVTVDSGYEGPQSRLNQFAEFCALSNQPGYTISSLQEAEAILGSQISTPGFRMIGFSQRLFREDVIDLPDAHWLTSTHDAMVYAEGADITLVACNFALPQTLALAAQLHADHGLSCGVVSVPRVDFDDFDTLKGHIEGVGKAVVLDDSHSKMGTGRRIASYLGSNTALFDRADAARNVAPNADVFAVTVEEVLGRCGIKT